MFLGIWKPLTTKPVFLIVTIKQLYLKTNKSYLSPPMLEEDAHHADDVRN